MRKLRPTGRMAGPECMEPLPLQTCFLFLPALYSTPNSDRACWACAPRLPPPAPYTYTHTQRPKAYLSGDPRTSYSRCVETIAQKCPGNSEMRICVVRIGLPDSPQAREQSQSVSPPTCNLQDAKGGTRACGPAPTCLSPEPAVHGTSSLVPWPTVATEKLTPG